MSEKTTILHIESHPLFRYGIASVVNSQPDMMVVAQASTGRQGIDYFQRQAVDIVLIDISLPDMSGIDAMTAIRSKFPKVRFVVLTSFARDNEIRRALSEGVYGYVLKTIPPRGLVDTIRMVRAGQRKFPMQIAATLAEHYNDEDLTGREVEVLRHLVDGNRNRDIARKMYKPRKP